MSEVIQIDQGTPEWLKMRLGVVTASCVYDILPSKKGGGFKQARQTYMHQLIAEVCTGHYEELNAKALSWGKENETNMIAAYEFDRGVKAQKGGFIYGMNKRVGCSPDILVPGLKRGAEGKCPFAPRTHIETLLLGKVKEEYQAQIQFSLWVSGFELWDFISFDPRNRAQALHVETFERDPAMMDLFSEIVPEFLNDMDKELSRLGAKFGDQWK